MSVNDFRTAPTTELFTVQDGSSINSSTFIFGNEDHTLGNVLRHMIVYRPETAFCGYSVPHPYEPKMHLRVQTVANGLPSMNALKQGLKDLEETANILDDHFLAALETYKNTPTGKVNATNAAAASTPATKSKKGSKKSSK